MHSSKSRPAGHIEELRDGRWLVRTSHGKDVTGKRIRCRKIIRGKKRDAQRYLTELLKREHEGFAPIVGRQTFGAWCEEWLTEWTSRLAPRTLAETKRQLQRLFRFEPALGGRRLAELTSTDIQAVVNRLQARGLSPRSVRMYHGVIRACLSKAERLGKVARNVARQAELPPQPRTERLFFNPKEAERFLRVAEESEDRFAALYALLLFTGLRPGEACALKWDDLEGRQLRVRRALVWLPDRAPLVADTKTRRSRVIALGDRPLRILQQHHTRQAEWRLRMGASYIDRGLIFANEVGGPLQLRNFTSRSFKPLLRRAGLPNLRLYDLRHTHATLLLAAGEHPKVVQERLGHSTITLTLDTYSHVVPGMQERAAARLDELLEKTATPMAPTEPLATIEDGVTPQSKHVAGLAQSRRLKSLRVIGRPFSAGSRSSA